MKDAYQILFDKTTFTKDEFFKIGIDNIIFGTQDKLEIQWEELKSNLKHNKALFIRGYSRDTTKTEAFFRLNKYLFGHTNLTVDKTNNLIPTQIIASLTNLKKTIKTDTSSNERIQNFQVSHIFGKTKNPLLFNAGWNIAYIPKYLDPFTGHETQGQISQDFKKMFSIYLKPKLQFFIDDYNSIVNDNIFRESLTKSIDLIKSELNMTDKSFRTFSTNAMNEFSPIWTEE